jgi:hypothetical protein
MDNFINIKQAEKSFLSRMKIKSLILIGIILLFIFVFLIKPKSGNFIFKITFVVLFYGLAFLYRIFKTRNYLIDFYSDSKEVRIRFFKYNVERIIETTLDNTEIKLVNRASKLGFNCELEIKINDIKFIVENEFDWSFTEMKNLFEYVSFHKNIKLTSEDKFNLNRLSEAIQKGR